MKSVTAGVLIAIMSICSIGVGYVLTELYAEDVVERTITALSEKRSAVDFSALDIDRWEIKNESSHGLSRQLSLRSISSHGVQAKRLSLDDAQDVNWAHAWLAAKRGQLSFRDRSFVYLLKDGKNGVETTRLSITQLPRPELPLLGVLATLLILAMWLVSVRMRPSGRTVLFCSVEFIPVWVMTIEWCFDHA